MDSETIEDSSEDFMSRSRRQTENYKVYTRRTKKRAHKPSNNNDTATTTCSTADLTSAVPSTSVANLTSSVTEVSSGAAVSEDPNCCDTASPPPVTIHDNLEAASPDRTARVHVEQLSPVATVTKDGDSHQPPFQEPVPQHGPLDKDADSSVQQLQEEMPSLLEDENSAQNQVRPECGNQTAEEQTFEHLLHSGVGEAKNLENPPAVLGANEPLQASDDRPPSMGEGSPLACGNDPPVGQEVTASDMPTGNGKEIVAGSECQALEIANGAAMPLVISTVDDRIRICLQKATLKDDIKELRKKLELELDQVRRLVKQFESKEVHLASYNTHISNSNLSINSSYMGPANIGQPQPQNSQIDVVNRRVLLRISSEMNAMKHHETMPTGLVRVNSDVGAVRNLEPRPYSRQLSIALMENSDQGIEKEKRTPKANQYYRNSEFLLGKDRLPPENTKRFKSNNGRKHSRETGHTFGSGFDKSGNRLFKSCGSLLQRLMKHKFGWVFNEPVDAKAMGLVDYHDIIKHPMDLGTIKTRLAENWYKSPGEFAEDVRLVFRNAMTYNPKGQDVHHMAEQLLQIFEERWAIIETEYNPFWKYHQDGGLRTPPSRKAPPPQSHLFKAAAPIPVFFPATTHRSAFVPTSASIPLGSASKTRSSDRTEPMATTTVVDPKIQRAHFGRTPVPKKPKAKDPNKRDMTYDEKQRLSTNLQGLPPEKLDAVVQIMQKRNTTVSQHGDEIEVDIDSVDTETLWELDRFITNYKKSLSKNKRKAELALQARMAADQNIQLVNSTPAVSAGQLESLAAIEKRTPPVEGEKQVDDRSGSSSSNSSSSDSGSSSSDSDSESSSADGSDTEHSPRT